jgi:hypothetical protein
LAPCSPPRYDRGVEREVEELRRLLERLAAENAMLRAGNEVLRRANARLARLVSPNEPAR